MYENMKNEIDQFIINAGKNSTRYMPNKYPDVCQWLTETYPSRKLVESAYLWINDATIPTCPECGAVPNFISYTKGYLVFCSSKCSNSSAATKKKAETTTLERYGVTNASKADCIKLKKAATTFEHYGVQHPLQAREVRAQIEATNLEKYGHSNVLQNTEIKSKITKTNLERYGVENPAQCAEIKNKIRQSNIENGMWSTEVDDFTLYKRTVWNITERSWRKYKHILDPQNNGRSMCGYHLDHMFSITEAYNNDLPPEHIGHVCNLQLMLAVENKQKFVKCSHTYANLLEKINKWRD